MSNGKFIPIVPPDSTSRARYLSHQKLPDNYMGDFSLMGLVVDPYPQSLVVLRSAGWKLFEVEDATELWLENAQQIVRIVELLSLGNIYCEYRDIADTLYQA